jgi:hypothetical protein
VTCSQGKYYSHFFYQEGAGSAKKHAHNLLSHLVDLYIELGIQYFLKYSTYPNSDISKPVFDINTPIQF